MAATANFFNPAAYNKGDKVWIPHPTDAWQAGEVFEPTKDGKGVLVKTDDGFRDVRPATRKEDGVQVSKEDQTEKNKYYVFELPPRNPNFMEGANDLTSLSYLNEPSILYNLRLRFLDGTIYTYTGPILVALNPWRNMPLYTDEVIRSYIDAGRSPKGTINMAPHVYAHADEAYRTMVKSKKSQCLLVSGESGSGKTESCKILMRYLTIVSTRDGASTPGGSVNIERKLLETNPILEAFGNAKTINNHNSSRFGKFIEVQFDSAGKVAGARIETYLLERARVVHLGASDRNFHIFYQLVAGAGAAEREALDLRPSARDYYYLNQSETSLPGTDDAAEFQATRTAMAVIGMNTGEQMDAFRVLSAILHLGDLTFDKDREDFALIGDTKDKLGRSGKSELEIVSTLLNLDKATLETALTSRVMVARGESVTVKYSVDQAIDARDALAKTLYGHLFDWLVQRVNTAIKPERPVSAFIGLLDIFGFESLERNSFEQLCINYANEKLQQFFNNHVFKLEQKAYREEQINWRDIEFEDNQNMLDLIEGKTGLFNLLDEQCLMQQGTDGGFVAAILAQLKDDPRLQPTRFSKNQFIVQHYAGPVTYEGGGFLDKNRDALHPNLTKILVESTDPFVQTLFPRSKLYRSEKTVASQRVEGRRARTGSISGQTVASALQSATLGNQFKSQLSDLMRKLNSTFPYFVRCMKPNSEASPSNFNGVEVARQLRCGGVIDAVRITKSMYPSHIDHLDFYKRYTGSHEWNCWIARYNNGRLFPVLTAAATIEQAAEGCKALCVALQLKDPEDYQIGRSKIFCRAGLVAKLDERMIKYLYDSATLIRAVYLGWRARALYKTQKAAAALIQRVARGFAARLRAQELREIRAALIIQRFFRTQKALQDFKSALYVEKRRRYAERMRQQEEDRRKKGAVMIQKHFRRFVQESKYQAGREAVIKIQAAHRGRTVRKHNKIKRGEGLLQDKKRLEAQLVDAQATIQLEQEARAALQAEKDETTRQLEEQRAQRVAREGDIASLKAELAEARRNAEAQATAYATLQTEKENLQVQHAQTIEQFNAERARLEENLKFTEDKVKSYEQQASQLQGLVSIGSQKGENLARIVSHMSGNLNRLSKEFKHQSVDTKLAVMQMQAELYKEFHAKISLLKHALTQAWREKSERNLIIADLENDVDSLNRKNEELIAELERAENSIKQEKGTVATQKEDIRKLQTDLANSQLRNQSSVQLYHSLDRKTDALAKDLKAERAINAELTRRLNEAAQGQPVLRMMPMPSTSNATGAPGASPAVPPEAYRAARRKSAANTGTSGGQVGYGSPAPPAAKVKNMSTAPSTEEEAEMAAEVRNITSRSAAGAVRMGVLYKEGGTFKSWKKRWAVLDTAYLSYYEAKTDKVAKGRVDLDAVTIERVDDHKGLPRDVRESQAFRVNAPGLKKPFFFYAETEEDAAAWLAGIEGNIKLIQSIRNVVHTQRNSRDPRITEFFANERAQYLRLENEPLFLEDMVPLTLIFNLKRHKQLHTIALTNSNLTKAEIAIFAPALGDCEGMRSLFLTGNRLADDGASELAQGLYSSKSITELGLSNNQIGDAGVAALGSLLSSHPRLRILDLSKNAISDNGVMSLSKAIIKLKEAQAAADKKKADKKAKAARKAEKEKGKEEEAPPSPSSASASSPASTPRKLATPKSKMAQDMKRRANSATRDQATPTAAAKTPKEDDDDDDDQEGPEGDNYVKTVSILDELNLSLNRIGDPGTVALAQMLERTAHVMKLNLSGNVMAREGSRALARALEKNNTLISLNLSNNPIDGEGCGEILKMMALNTGIMELDLSGVNADTGDMTQHLAAAAIRARLTYPALKIERSPAS